MIALPHNLKRFRVATDGSHKAALFAESAAARVTATAKSFTEQTTLQCKVLTIDPAPNACPTEGRASASCRITPGSQMPMYAFVLTMKTELSGREGDIKLSDGLVSRCAKPSPPRLLRSLWVDRRRRLNVDDSCEPRGFLPCGWMGPCGTRAEQWSTLHLEGVYVEKAYVDVKDELSQTVLLRFACRKKSKRN